MQTKLTLRLDDDVIEKAKRYAKHRQTSLSRLVAKYFKFLSNLEKPQSKKSLPPITRSLWGVLEDADFEESSYLEYLEGKYR